MRIHTNRLSASSVAKALEIEQAAGRIAPHVSFKTLQEHGSRTHDHAIEIQLEAEVRDNGRRAGNSGSYGAMRPEYDGYAATFDEWGWLIAALYKLDPRAVWGSVKYPQYKNFYDFDEKTGMTYHPEVLLPLLEEGHWPTFVGHDDYTGGDPYAYVYGRSNRIGRRGAGRIETERGRIEEARGWGVKLAPRSPAEYLTFAHINSAALHTDI